MNDSNNLINFDTLKFFPKNQNNFTIISLNSSKNSKTKANFTKGSQFSAQDLCQEVVFSSFFDKIKINSRKNVDNSFNSLENRLDTNFAGTTPNLAKTLLNFKFAKFKNSKNKSLDLTLVQSETVISFSKVKTNQKSTIIPKSIAIAFLERRFLLTNNSKSETQTTKRIRNFKDNSKIELENNPKISAKENKINFLKNIIPSQNLEKTELEKVKFETKNSNLIKNLWQNQIKPKTKLNWKNWKLEAFQIQQIVSILTQKINLSKNLITKTRQEKLEFRQNIDLNKIKLSSFWKLPVSSSSKISNLVNLETEPQISKSFQKSVIFLKNIPKDFPKNQVNLKAKSTQIWENSQMQIVKSLEFIQLIGNLIITFLVQIWASLFWQSFLTWGEISKLADSFKADLTQKNDNLTQKAKNNFNLSKEIFVDCYQNSAKSFSKKLLTKSQNNNPNNPTFPNFYKLIAKPFGNNLDGFSEFFQTNLTRDFWWLERKLEIRKIQIKTLRKLQKILQKYLFLVKKFYLVVWTVLLLAIFNFSSFSTFQGIFPKNPKVQFDTISVEARSSVIDFRSFNSQKNAPKNLDSVKKIVAHTFSKDDSVAKLAELYNLSIKTVRFNNQIAENEEPIIGKTLYIPWQNGYILNNPEETLSKEIATLYKLDEQSIIQTNQPFWNEKTKKFPKNVLLLLPTTDFEQISQIQKNEKNRQNTIQEANKQRDKMLNYTAVETNNEKSKKTDFIWPAVGTISRCLQPGHIACDIANFASPPIFAVQDGVVLEAGWKDGGFGYMTLLDHGNGLQTMYMHMENVQVIKGQKLAQGQTIGKMGCTGNCSGTHLHFEVRQNKIQQNPLLYLP